MKPSSGVRMPWAALIVAMILILATALATAAPIKIEIWGNSRHLDALKPIVEKFNQSQDEIVVSIPGKPENPDTILAAHLAGQLPAIIESARVYTTQYSSEGLMADLTPFIEREPKDFLDDFIPATLRTDNMIDGRVYSLPSFLQINNLYYNPEVLSGVGVSPPQKGWTWDDLRDSARKARTVDSEGKKQSWGLIGESPFALDWTILGQPENQATWLTSLGYPPATFSAARHPIFVDYMEQHPNMKIFAEQYFTLPNALVYPIALNRVNVFGDAMAAARQLVNGDITLSEYIANQESYFKAKIEEYNTK